MKLKNISGKEIYVNAKPRKIEEEFEEEKSQEIKNLISNGYIVEIK